MSKHLVRGLLVLQALLVLISLGYAQSTILDIPRASQHAVITQRIGITDITINYHRPLVNKRKVWDGLVPYGQVWRAGANENTTITFTTPVSIEDKALAAGTYGLHMFPGENEWIVVFSKNSTSWGAFTYNQAEDALRVTVKPQAADFHEALTYDFADPTPNSAVVILQWEKLAVPFKVGVNTNEIVQQSLHNQLRGLGQYTWFGYDDAANFLLASKVGLEDALKYSDNSIQNEDRYENEMTKSQVLDALGRKNDADAAKKKALAKADAVQMHTYGRQLQGEGKQAEAFTVFQENARKNPDNWIVHVGLARMYSGQGKFPEASKEMTTALASAPEVQKQPLQGLLGRLNNKEDINK